MTIRNVSTEEELKIVIEPLQEIDLKKISITRYFFDWKAVANETNVYKLRLKGNDDILGLMALIDHPREQRIEVKLLAVSRENVILLHEINKKINVYEEMAGNLLAFAAKMAMTKYGELACISLVPKTELKEHYMQEYGMLDAGLSVYLELKALQKLITTYKL